MSSKNHAQVLIDGRVYTLSGYESEEYLNKVASYINNKIFELKQGDTFRRQNKEVQNTLIHLNIADDYYKIKKQTDLLELEIESKNKEIYDLKHELISTQIKFDALKNDFDRVQKEASELEKNVIKLETELASELKNKQ
ncbi:MAG: cell division protein ZapA [Clostridiales bacterium]|nr:cell division protein ZapA [Clostridiales bacterium]